MEEMKSRCTLNDRLVAKYKFPSPATSCTATSSTVTTTELQTARRVLFEELEENQSTCVNTQEEDECFSNNPILSVDDNIVQEQREDYNSLDNQQTKDDNISYTTPMDEVEAEELPTTQVTHVKKYYCPFCRQLYAKFARHIFQVHGGENQVKEISSLPPKDPKRTQILNRLRSEGTRIFNNITMTPENKIVARRKPGFDIKEYVQCYMCGNMYKSKFLHRHMKNCPNSDGTCQKNPLRTAKCQSYTVADKEDENIIKLNVVLAGLREGEVKTTIEKDSLIKEYGKYLCSLYGGDTHLVNLIRRKLRQVSELLIELKSIDKDVQQLEDIFTTTKKKSLFQAIKNVAGFEKGSFRRPAFANEMGTLLQHCARRLISRLLEVNDIDKTKDVKRWIELIRSDYNAFVSKHARKTLDENKWNKPRTLPLHEDVQKLNLHVKKNIKSATEHLQKEFFLPEYCKLVKSTMVQLLTFNRKRVGDVDRMRLEDFKKAHNVQKGTLPYTLLSESERLTCSNYMRVETRGKHAKVVPLLLTHDMMRHIQQIISMRDLAQIPKENPFVFARDTNKTFSTSRSLSEMAYECGAKSPQFLTGTKLRKEIATATQAFNFSQNDLTILANYLGHSLQTHSTFYRLPDEAIQLAKISKLLELVDAGRASELKDKSLSELESYVIEAMNLDDDKIEETEKVPTTAVSVPVSKHNRIKIVRRTWTTPEKFAMKKYFKHHLANGSLPTPLECVEAKQKFSPLKQRTAMQIKAWVNNQNKKRIITT